MFPWFYEILNVLWINGTRKLVLHTSLLYKLCYICNFKILFMGCIPTHTYISVCSTVVPFSFAEQLWMPAKVVCIGFHQNMCAQTLLIQTGNQPLALLRTIWDLLKFCIHMISDWSNCLLKQLPSEWSSFTSRIRDGSRSRSGCVTMRVHRKPTMLYCMFRKEYREATFQTLTKWLTNYQANPQKARSLFVSGKQDANQTSGCSNNPNTDT